MKCKLSKLSISDVRILQTFLDSDSADHLIHNPPKAIWKLCNTSRNESALQVAQPCIQKYLSNELMFVQMIYSIQQNLKI